MMCVRGTKECDGCYDCFKNETQDIYDFEDDEFINTYMHDYNGDFNDWQKKLDIAGIDFDVTNLAGGRYREIDNYVNMLLENKRKAARQ